MNWWKRGLLLKTTIRIVLHESSFPIIFQHSPICLTCPSSMSHYCHTCSSAGQCGHAAYSSSLRQSTPLPPFPPLTIHVPCHHHNQLPPDRFTLAMAQMLWWRNTPVQWYLSRVDSYQTLCIHNPISNYVCSYLAANTRASKKADKNKQTTLMKVTIQEKTRPLLSTSKHLNI